MKSKKQECSVEDCLNFLLMTAKSLSLPYEEQYLSIEDFARWNLPDDIANEWDWNYLKYFSEKLLNEKILEQKVVLLIKKICDNFLTVSFGEPSFDKDIWTHDAMKTHPFWENQRRLAKELLVELEKIKIEMPSQK